jgi:hypothetical protein
MSSRYAMWECLWVQPTADACRWLLPLLSAAVWVTVHTVSQFWARRLAQRRAKGSGIAFKEGMWPVDDGN